MLQVPISKYPILDQHRYRVLPDIEPDIEPDIGIRYMLMSGYPILNPKSNPISVYIHADIGTPDIDRDIDPDIGYLIADIVS